MTIDNRAIHIINKIILITRYMYNVLNITENINILLIGRHTYIILNINKHNKLLCIYI